MNFLTHLILKGNDTTIPLCGDTTLGKVATYNKANATCEVCLAELSRLLSLGTYGEACSYVSKHSNKPNLEAHKVIESVYKNILGTDDEFWKSIHKLEE